MSPRHVVPNRENPSARIQENITLIFNGETISSIIQGRNHKPEENSSMHTAREDQEEPAQLKANPLATRKLSFIDRKQIYSLYRSTQTQLGSRCSAIQQLKIST